MQRELTRIIISASVHEECGIDPTLRIELDMAYCWNHVRITCELGSIPTVGIGGQVAWFPYLSCTLEAMSALS